MKKTSFLLIVILLASCAPQSDQTQHLQSQIEELQQQLQETYKPGFGEFMSRVQAHHIKLWFAGKNQNWKLADFEIKEIMETIADIQKTQTDREETKMIGIIEPALDSVNTAIQKKDPVLFKDSYTFMTNTCNKCHRDANFEFNVVKIPESQPFSDQVFKTSQ